MLMRRPSWWSHNGGPFILLGAVLLMALFAAAMRMWIGPPGDSSDAGLGAALVAAVEATALIACTRRQPSASQHNLSLRRHDEPVAERQDLALSDRSTRARVDVEQSNTLANCQQNLARVRRSFHGYRGPTLPRAQ